MSSCLRSTVRAGMAATSVGVHTSCDRSSSASVRRFRASGWRFGFRSSIWCLTCLAMGEWACRRLTIHRSRLAATVLASATTSPRPTSCFACWPVSGSVSCRSLPSSPYYAPHGQRPAYFPPSDGYQPPEDPLVGVARIQAATSRAMRRAFVDPLRQRRHVLSPGLAAQRWRGDGGSWLVRLHRSRSNGSVLPAPTGRCFCPARVGATPHLPNVLGLHNGTAGWPGVGLLSP